MICLLTVTCASCVPRIPLQYRDLLIVLPMREPSIFRGIAFSLLRPVIDSNVEIDVVALRPIRNIFFPTSRQYNVVLPSQNRNLFLVIPLLSSKPTPLEVLREYSVAK